LHFGAILPCQHAGECPTPQLPGTTPHLIPPALILLLIDLTRLQRAFGINDPTPCGINDPAMKGRE
jgi:hypothetical protein